MDDTFSLGLFPLITKPTRLTEFSGTLIDQVYTNIQDLNSISGIIVTDVADHFGIFSIVKKQSCSPATKHIYVRSFKSNNIDNFNSLLNNTNFDEILACECPDVAYSKLQSVIESAYNVAFPLIKRNGSNRNIKRERWISDGILQSAKTKTKLYRKKLNNPSVANIHNYKQYCITFRKIRRQAKLKYYHETFEMHKHDCKRTWSILRPFVSNKSSSSSLPKEFNIDNNRITDPIIIANEFNTFFVGIGHKTSETVSPANKPYSHYLNLTPHQNDSMFLEPVLIPELISVCNLLKSKSSMGHDNMSTKLMKRSINYLAIPLCHIFNLSFSLGIVPNSMKVAKVIPIFKSGDMKSFNNYRPISILPAFSKLLEKLVAKRLVNFLDKFDILYSHQYGFRINHSTVHPIMHFLKDISNANDKPTKDSTLGLFIDLSKAFDTINHSALLTKLNHYGIRGVANLWFNSYLSNRMQYTVVNDTKSEILNILCGVPQGSILGPILFLIYINDIQKCTNLSLLSFADDTTVYASRPNLVDLYDFVNLELTKLNDWFSANKLALNVKKTKYVIFSPKTSIPPANKSIAIDGKTISRVGNNQTEKSIKFLGISIDENLTWKFHIQNIKSKLCRSLFAINRVKRIFPHDILKTIYFSLIQSHLMYGICSWGSANNLSKLETLQKRAITLINNKPFNSHTEPLFKANSILKLSDIYSSHVSLFAHDCMNNRLPRSFNHFFMFNNHDNSRTRHNNHIRRSRPRTKFTANLPFHHIPTIWNSLSNNLTELLKRTLPKNLPIEQISHNSQLHKSNVSYLSPLINVPAAIISFTGRNCLHCAHVCSHTYTRSIDICVCIHVCICIYVCICVCVIINSTCMCMYDIRICST